MCYLPITLCFSYLATILCFVSCLELSCFMLFWKHPVLALNVIPICIYFIFVMPSEQDLSNYFVNKLLFFLFKPFFMLKVSAKKSKGGGI